MGSWGYGPFDNDESHTWLIESIIVEIEKALFFSIEDSFTWAEERRAASHLLYTLWKADIMVMHMCDLAKIAMWRLNEILHDEWVDNFDNPQKVKKSIQKQIKQMQDIVDDSDCDPGPIDVKFVSMEDVLEDPKLFMRRLDIDDEFE